MLTLEISSNIEVGFLLKKYSHFKKYYFLIYHSLIDVKTKTKDTNNFLGYTVVVSEQMGKRSPS